MRYTRILGVAVLSLLVMAQYAMTQRGGARGGVRGAVVGGAVGGSEGAEKGAKIGVVTGATRSAMDRESQARTQYQTTDEYKSAQHSNFNEAPPDIGSTATGAAKKPSGEAVIRKDGKPLVGITFPSDWNQKISDNCISAVSGDGEAYSMLITLEGASDKQAGGKKVKVGLEKYLKDIKFDEPTETKGGALVITGTGKAKMAGVDVVFAAAVFDAGKDQLVGAAFVVNAKIEDHYKATVRGICETLRRAKDFDKD